MNYARERVNAYEAIQFFVENDCLCPTVTPQEPKTGHWIEHKWAEEVDNRLISNFECSCCHTWKRDKSNYCPNCGAKMESEDKE